MDKNRDTAKSMADIFSSTSSSTASTKKTKFSFFLFNSQKKSAKKLMKQSNGYGSYSNLFRAKSFDSLCTDTTATLRFNKK